MDNRYTRRKLFGIFFRSGSIVLAAAYFAACGEDKSKEQVANPVDACRDLSEVPETDLNARKKLGYVNESPMSEKTCNKCNLWLPPSAKKACGGCMLFKGPVEPSGYCTYWVAQQEI